MSGLLHLKGLEAMPLRIMASLVLIAIVVSVGFYELNTFLTFQKEKTFKEELVNVRQSMRTLQSLGDKGSFTSIELTVPGGYSVFFNNQTDQVIGNLTSETFTVNLTAHLKTLSFPGNCYDNGCSLSPADYEIRLIYGYGVSKNYTVIFE